MKLYCWQYTATRSCSCDTDRPWLIMGHGSTIGATVTVLDAATEIWRILTWSWVLTALEKSLNLHISSLRPWNPLGPLDLIFLGNPGKALEFQLQYQITDDVNGYETAFWVLRETHENGNDHNIREGGKLADLANHLCAPVEAPWKKLLDPWKILENPLNFILRICEDPVKSLTQNCVSCHD